jgi:hypothetical protein
MGGKSSSVRMIALIALMAQIGSVRYIDSRSACYSLWYTKRSYVPAKSVKLGMLDGILTRMGGMSDFDVFESPLIGAQHPMNWPGDVLLLWWRCQKRVKFCKRQLRTVS